MSSTSPTVQDILAVVLERGFKRIILLGTEEQMTAPTYRKPLAASGVLVMVPGAADRACLNDDAKLKETLAHGLEHGVDALVVLDSELARAVERLNLSVPVIA